MIRVRNARILTNRGTRLVDIVGYSKGIVLVGKTKPRDSFERDYDVKGSIVLPSLIDCHTHLFSLGQLKEMANLRGATSIGEIRDRLVAHKQKFRFSKRNWLLGRGWDQDILQEKRFPSKHDLDHAIGEIPTMIVRVCGHIAVLNSAALSEINGLEEFDQELVDREMRKEISGLVREEALEACWLNVPKPSIERIQQRFLIAQVEALNSGLIGAHIILSENWRNELKVIRKLDQNGGLTLRLSLFLPISSIDEVEKMKEKESKLNGKRFVTLGFKLFSDGSLGARTAALCEPYSDDSKNRGVLNYTSEEISGYAVRASRLNLILAVHAIGDRAIAEVAKGFKKSGVDNLRNFRVEHCSVLTEEMVQNLRGYILSVQPSFATSDYWVDKRLGSHRKAYIFKTLLSEGLTLVGGSDSPVEELSPFAGIRAAMANPLKEERLNLDQAIRLYTESAAGASPITRRMGAIEPNKEFNLIVLGTNSRKGCAFAKITNLIFEGEMFGHFSEKDFSSISGNNY